MKILFTGASSFTGFYFVRRLVRDGHDVISTASKRQGDYSGIRATRLNELGKFSRIIWDLPFGEPGFCELLQEKFDVLVIHFAHMRNYKSNEFDVYSALEINTKNIDRVTQIFSSHGGSRIILTGSIFEPYECISELKSTALSPYGLSKQFTSMLVQFWAKNCDLKFSKFVIPNPFGSLEEMKFTRYLRESWRDGKVAIVNTPRYIRDNIHVSVLAEHYSLFVNSALDYASPSGFVGSQEEFVRRFACEIRERTGEKCELYIADQKTFTEPLIRIGRGVSVPFDATQLNKDAWDDIAANYT